MDTRRHYDTLEPQTFAGKHAESVRGTQLASGGRVHASQTRYTRFRKPAVLGLGAEPGSASEPRSRPAWMTRALRSRRDAQEAAEQVTVSEAELERRADAWQKEQAEARAAGARACCEGGRGNARARADERRRQAEEASWRAEAQTRARGTTFAEDSDTVRLCQIQGRRPREGHRWRHACESARVRNRAGAEPLRKASGGRTLRRRETEMLERGGNERGPSTSAGWVRRRVGKT